MCLWASCVTSTRVFSFAFPRCVNKYPFFMKRILWNVPHRSNQIVLSWVDVAGRRLSGSKDHQPCVPSSSVLWCSGRTSSWCKAWLLWLIWVKTPQIWMKKINVTLVQALNLLKTTIINKEKALSFKFKSLRAADVSWFYELWVEKDLKFTALYNLTDWRMCLCDTDDERASIFLVFLLVGMQTMICNLHLIIVKFLSFPSASYTF